MFILTEPMPQNSQTSLWECVDNLEGSSTEVDIISPELSVPAHPQTTDIPTPLSSKNNIPRVQGKRKRGNEDAYANAIASVAESLRQPIVIANGNNNNNSHVPTISSEDGISGLLMFLGSIIRSIENEELRLDLINNLVKTVVNCRTLDLERSRSRR